MIKSDEVSFCAIGGGPGTELLGISKFYRKFAKPGQGIAIDVRILDAQPGWQENLAALSEGVRFELKKTYGERKEFPFIHSHNFSLVNTGDESSYANYADVVSADIVICSYFISEVFAFDRLETLLTEMRSAAKNKPYYLLLIDRCDSGTRDKMDEFIEHLAAEIVYEHQSKSYLDLDEQTSDLKDYIDLIGRRPRTTWQASAILAKVS